MDREKEERERQRETETETETEAETETERESETERECEGAIPTPDAMTAPRPRVCPAEATRRGRAPGAIAGGRPVDGRKGGPAVPAAHARRDCAVIATRDHVA